MVNGKLSGTEFKNQLRAGQPKLGLFLNSHSPTIAEQLAHSGYDWLLVDTQHGPMGNERLSAMLSALPLAQRRSCASKDSTIVAAFSNRSIWVLTERRKEEKQRRSA